MPSNPVVKGREEVGVARYLVTQHFSTAIKTGKLIEDIPGTKKESNNFYRKG